MDLFLNNFGIIFTLVLFGVGYVFGSIAEKNHFRELVARENALRNFPTMTFAPPKEWVVRDAGLVMGSCVVSLDYFKRILAGLRSVVGGRITVYEPLLDRARREATLRMIDDARRRGFTAVTNIRLETSAIASPQGNNKGTAGVEIVAFGTGVRAQF